MQVEIPLLQKSIVGSFIVPLFWSFISAWQTLRAPHTLALETQQPTLVCNEQLTWKGGGARYQRPWGLHSPKRTQELQLLWFGVAASKWGCGSLLIFLLFQATCARTCCSFKVTIASRLLCRSPTSKCKICNVATRAESQHTRNSQTFNWD